MTENLLNQSCCCCGGNCSPNPKKQTPTITDAHLKLRDYFGFIAMRLGFGRNHYTTEPGLYAFGTPTAESPVLVTANYKMTFDVLRSRLDGINAWILVLDTHGINVWCAAGKGTFGTDEIVQKIEQTGLADAVSHRNIIVPQLGAPGVAAHEVKRRTGFKIHYGPIRAGDIRPYLNAGMKATPEMRQAKFPLADRIVLAPLELTVMFKWMVLFVIILLGLSGFHGTNFSWERVVNTGVPTVGLLLTAWIASGFLVTFLLPYLSGKMLSAKGLQVGLILALLLCIYWTATHIPQDGLLGISGLALLIIGISSYLGLVLTGSMP